MVDAVQDGDRLAHPCEPDVAEGVDVVPRASDSDGLEKCARLDDALEALTLVYVVDVDAAKGRRTPREFPGLGKTGVYEAQVPDADHGSGIPQFSRSLSIACSMLR